MGKNYSDKMKQKGCVRVTIWVPKDYANAFKKLARDKINEKGKTDG